ncbi:Oidioi.mRNA.OKI2018_I69.XSR.g13810.t1.cds [Oikopleura dioica]|nr:Oidioi.mRNA.OKI2018_I69.XSR.g13810.t1.cds [Oikopleura dioica]
MFVRTTEERRDTTNVLGYFEGTVEPDRYVILGNHRDAWVFGAIDPSSGTCTMLEIVRVFGEMYRKGWRPRRTIMFASWGSEEYGLIGSQEFVEEHLTQLTASAVAYVNIDVAVGGNYSLSTRGTPNFEDLMFETAKTVDNPRKVEDDGAASLYDNMMLRNAKDENGKLVFGGVGSGSDYAPFLQQVGVSVCDISWRCDPHYSYPVYHSVYETVPLVEKFVDPGYKIHQQVAKFTAKMMAQLSQDAKIPLKVVQYAARVSKEVNSLETALNNYPSNGVDLTFLKQYANKFTKAAADFQAKFEDATDAQEIKRLNDQVMRVERSFIDPNGLPERLQYRHVVFAPSSKNSYASAAFPAVYDALFEIEKLTGYYSYSEILLTIIRKGEEEVTAWEMVKEQVSTLSFFIYNAAEALKLSVI